MSADINLIGHESFPEPHSRLLIERKTSLTPVIGFRTWIPIEKSLSNNKTPELKSISCSHYNWHPGTNSAVCKHTLKRGYKLEEGPTEYCHCGLYALHKIPGVPTFRVVGAIMSYGKVIVYPEGFRASKAKIVALLEHPKINLKEFGEHYQVPVLPRELFDKFAYEFGESAQPHAEDFLFDTSLHSELWYGLNHNPKA